MDQMSPTIDPLPDGLVSAMDEQGVVEVDPQKDECARAHSAQIERFENEQAFPSFIRDHYDEVDALRKFVHTDAMVPKTKGAVAENLVLRNQYIRMAQTWARNPDLSVQPRKLLPPVPTMVEMVDQMAMEAMLGDFKSYLESLGLFGTTIEILVKNYFDQADGSRLLEGAMQDVQTDGLWWMKMTWQENMGKDPLGCHRANDFQDTVNRLNTLVQQFEDGEFDENDARYGDLKDLSETVREQVLGEQWVTDNYATTEVQDPATGEIIQQRTDPREMRWNTGETATSLGVAELPRDRRFRLDPVDPTDIRRDWSVTRPEEWRKCKWVSHRLWMTDDEIRDEFSLTDEDLRDVLRQGPGTRVESEDPRVTGSTSETLTTEDPADRSEVEKMQRNGQRAVWERWDKSANRRYVWIAGTHKFLVNEVPEVVSKFWYPFFLLYWNRVTGRFEPVPDAKLQKELNEEYNLLRTHDRQARKAAYNKYIIAKNLMTKEEKEKLESCPPEGVIECRRANEVRKYLQVVVGSNYNPALYDTTKVRMALDEAANIPSSARGNTSTTKFATSDQIANQVMGEQADRYRGNVEWFCREVFEAMADILVQVLPEANAKAIAGPGAVWPLMDRETLWRNLALTIEAGSTGKPDQQRKLALYRDMAAITQSLGIGGPTSQWEVNGVQVFKDLLDVMNIRVEPERYLIRRMLPPIAGPGAGGQPGAPPGAASDELPPEAGSGGDMAGDEVPPPSPPPGNPAADAA